MCVVVFEVDNADDLELMYGDEFRQLHAKIHDTLIDYGFAQRQATIYMGNVSKGDAVSCILEAKALAKGKDWFLSNFRIGMIRV